MGSDCEADWHGPLTGVSYKCGAIQVRGCAAGCRVRIHRRRSVGTPGLFVCVAAAPMVVVLLVALFIGGAGRLSLDRWLTSRVGRVFHGRA